MTMRRMPKDERRAALIQACIEVARRNGLAATSGRDVAAESGTSIGLVHHYFGSVDSLVTAAFEQVEEADLDSAREALALATTPQRKMAALVDYFEPQPGDWRYQFWIDAWSLAPRRPVLQEAARRLNLEWRDLIRQVLDDGVAAGAFDTPDTDAASWRILVLLDGFHLHASAGQVDVPQQFLREWTRSALAAEVGLAALEEATVR